MARLTPEQREEARVAKARLNEDAAKNWGDPDWQRETALAIQMQIEEGFEHENLLDLLTTVETAADGDRIFIEEMLNVDAHWVSPGGRVEESNWGEEIFEVKPDAIVFGLSELAEKMRSNFADKQAKIVQGGIKALDAGINSRLLSVLRSATPYGSASYTDGAGVAIATINTLLTKIRDESQADSVSIVGRGTMIDQIYNQIQNAVIPAPNAQDNILSSGYLGTYRGANLIKLINWRDNKRESYFPANELFVVGADASLVGLWGGLETASEVTFGVNNSRWVYEGRRKAGFVCYRPERIHRVVDTSLPA